MIEIKCLINKTLLVLILINISVSYSQNNLIDTVHLREVVIESNKIRNFAIGTKIESIDTTIIKYFNNNSVADLLSRQSTLFIKTNGMTGLATCSFRGTGAGHTAILWNGFSLQSPMNGQIDLSIIPVKVADNIQLQYGGSGALFGNGAIGGVIHINNSKFYNKGLSIGIINNIGSYENYYQDFDFNLSKERYILSLNIFNHSGENNFTFKNIAKYGYPIEKLKYADIKQYGVIEENYFKINNRQNINFRLWYQNNNRNLPTTMLQDALYGCNNNQKDESYRFSGEWQRTGNIYYSTIRSGYFIESIDFMYNTISPNAKSKSETFVNEIENKFILPDNHLINLCISNIYSTAKSDNYEKLKHMNQLSAIASYKYNNIKNTLKISLNIREVFIDNKVTPVLPSIGIEYKVFKNIIINGNISRNYRVPTLNDLYWANDLYSGGNSELKPENGWSEEIGINYESKIFKLNISGFNSVISDWIIWLPDGSIWKPQNISQVWSRGIESELKLQNKINNLKINLSGTTSYTLSTNQKTKSDNDMSLGKQLLYVPKFNAQGNIILEYKTYNIIYNQTYTGIRWTTADNTESLKPYTLGNLICGKQFYTSHFQFDISFHINNIWNVNYQVIEWVPMPQRNYQFSLKINYNKSLK